MAETKVEENKKLISANRKAVFQLEHQILKNKTQAYLLRELVGENRDLIHRNYEAAFAGNRQLINANTDALYRNRVAFIRACTADGQVQANFREATLNAARLSFLDHRSKTNTRVSEITAKLAAINAQLIDVNKEIMDVNATLVAYNAEQIAANATLFDKPKVLSGLKEATPEKNAELIKANAAKIQELLKRAEANAKRNAELLEAIKANRARIEANAKAIAERRSEIEKNAGAIAANTSKILEFAFD